MFKFELFVVLLSASLQVILTAILDCQRPPQLVDPAQCCLDGGRDEVAEICAQRMGITEQTSSAIPLVETAACLAECILTESKYMQKSDTVELGIIKADLYSKFPNDTIYADVMTAAFQKCQPTAQAKMKAFKQIALDDEVALKRTCSPFAGIILGCTYIEYFKNCPAHRWTSNPECNLAKQFVRQCSLGA